MTLNDSEYHQYLATHLKLLFYVGIEQQLLPAFTTFEAFVKLPFQRKFLCREALYSHIHLLDKYISLNARYLDPEETQLIQGFKKFIKSDFIILKCLKQHAIFIDSRTEIIYAVKALHDRFDEFFHRFPVYCSTALVPFKNMIVYDGFINTQGNILLGPRISAGMNEKYLLARKKNSIVHALQ